MIEHLCNRDAPAVRPRRVIERLCDRDGLWAPLVGVIEHLCIQSTPGPTYEACTPVGPVTMTTMDVVRTAQILTGSSPLMHVPGAGDGHEYRGWGRWAQTLTPVADANALTLDTYWRDAAGDVHVLMESLEHPWTRVEVCAAVHCGSDIGTL